MKTTTMSTIEKDLRKMKWERERVCVREQATELENEQKNKQN